MDEFDLAERFILEQLNRGPKEVREVMAEAKRRGIRKRHLTVAKNRDRLVETYKWQGVWYWKLKEGADL